MTVEHDLSARLTALADDLTWADPTVSADAVVARHRRQRRARAGVVAAVAAVVALVVAVPTAIGSLSADGGEAAGPGVPSAPATAGTPEESAAEEAERQAAEAAAARAEAMAARFAALAARLGGPVSLAAPAVGDACPDLAEPLGQVLGTVVTDAVASSPTAPEGCSWASAAVSADYRFDLRFLADGTTAEQAAATFSVSPEMRPCPVSTSPEGQFLLDCSDLDGTGATHVVLLVPDTGDTGLWVLGARAAGGTPRPAVDALAALVGEVSALYG